MKRCAASGGTPSCCTAGAAIAASTIYSAVVGMPAPIAMQISAMNTSVTNSVSPCIDPMPAGSASTIGRNSSAVCTAACVTMKLTRKPAPVSVTTPTTMPTAAAAAPTASA